MGEMSLICPACQAEYRIPDDAIPAQGREVECSGCGHVWTAQRPRAYAPMDLGRFEVQPPATPPEPAPLSQRLPQNVLSILQDEVEHERRARAAEPDKEPAPAPAPTSTEPAAPEIDWPATTVTAHPQTMFPPRELTPPKPQPPSQAIRSRVESKRLEPENTAIEPGRETAVGSPSQTVPVQQRRSGYGVGFSLAAMIAAAIVALYVMAPGMADSGPFGAFLMQMREGADQARLWLQNLAAGVPT